MRDLLLTVYIPKHSPTASMASSECSLRITDLSKSRDLMFYAGRSSAASESEVKHVRYAESWKRS